MTTLLGACLAALLVAALAMVGAAAAVDTHTVDTHTVALVKDWPDHCRPCPDR